jgi:hypothetical protein
MNDHVLEQVDLGATDDFRFDDEATEILRWRLEQLERAGYTSEIAITIAEDDGIDLHDACDLVARGCPEHTAFLILA